MDKLVDMRFIVYDLIPKENIIILPNRKLKSILSIKSDNKELLNTNCIKDINLEDGIIILNEELILENGYTVEAIGEAIIREGVRRY